MDTYWEKYIDTYRLNKKSQIIFEHLDRIKEITGDVDINNEILLFRGVANEEYKLEASLYRKYKENREENIYSIVKYYNVKSFNNKGDFIKELIDLQHYNIPTPLLDWTKNVLIALFWAVNKHPDKNGSVYVYKLSKDNLYKTATKMYDRIEKYLKYKYNIIDTNKYGLNSEFLRKYVINNNMKPLFIGPNIENQRMRLQSGIFLLDLRLSEKEIKRLIKKEIEEIRISVANENIYNNYIEQLKKEDSIEKFLIDYLKNEIDYFYKELNKIGLSINILTSLMGDLNDNNINISFIGKLENLKQELTEQNLFQPLKTRISSTIYLVKLYLFFINSFSQVFTKPNLIKVIIEKKAKKRILEQLESIFNINYATIFPDREGVSYYIDNKIKNGEI